MGFSIASAYASYYLLQEYKFASSLLQSSVEELQESTAKVRHTNHIEINLLVSYRPADTMIPLHAYCLTDDKPSATNPSRGEGGRPIERRYGRQGGSYQAEERDEEALRKPQLQSRADRSKMANPSET